MLSAFTGARVGGFVRGRVRGGRSDPPSSALYSLRGWRGVFLIHARQFDAARVTE